MLCLESIANCFIINYIINNIQVIDPQKININSKQYINNLLFKSKILAPYLLDTLMNQELLSIIEVHTDKRSTRQQSRWQ